MSKLILEKHLQDLFKLEIFHFRQTVQRKLQTFYITVRTLSDTNISVTYVEFFD